MRKTVLVLAAAVALATTGVFAQSSNKFRSLSVDDFQLNSAKELLEICTLESAHPDFQTAIGFCYGFISGGGHFHDALSNGPEFDRMVCTPKGVTHDQVVKVFTTYTEDNPKFLEEPAMDVLFRAAVAEWPCG